MTRWLLLAFALGACDQVLGLEEVDPVALKVTGTFRYRTVVNNSAFEPMQVEEILPVDAFELVALVGNSETPVDYRADGSFSFPIDTPGEPYRIRYTAGAVVTEWQHTAREIAIGLLTAGRHDARPLVPTNVNVSSYVPKTVGQPLHLSSTGIYTQTSTGMAGPTVSFDWRLASPAAGAFSGLLDASKNDRIYAYEQESATEGAPFAYSRIRALTASSITQAQGTSAMLSAPAVVAPNLCVRATHNGAAEKTRMEVTHPRNYLSGKDTGSWLVYSTPAPDWVGLSGGIYTGFSPYAGARELDITPILHDPYLGSTIVVSAQAGLTFLTQQPGTGASKELQNITRVYAKAERGTPAACTPAVAQVDATVGLPGAFKLDGENLNFDNEEIALDLSRPPTLSWQVLAEGPIDFTAVAVYEVLAINNATEVVPRWSALAVGTSAQIEPAVLEVDHTYILAVVPQVGRPNATTGDFMTLEFPLQNSTIWTYSFIVRAPN